VPGRLVLVVESREFREGVDEAEDDMLTVPQLSLSVYRGK